MAEKHKRATLHMSASKRAHHSHSLQPIENAAPQVGFAEFNNTADNRANIGGTIIGAPIVGQ